MIENIIERVSTNIALLCAKEAWSSRIVRTETATASAER